MVGVKLQEQSASKSRARLVDALTRASSPLDLLLVIMAAMLQPQDYPVGPKPDWELDVKLGRLKSVLERCVILLSSLYIRLSCACVVVYYLRRCKNVCTRKALKQYDKTNMKS